MRIPVIGLLGLLCLCGDTAWCQPPGGDDDIPPNELEQLSPPVAGDAMDGFPENNPDFDGEAAGAVFEQRLSDFRQAMAEMRTAMIYFNNLPASETEKWRQRYRELEAVGRQHYDALFETALELVLNVPRDYPQAAHFLLLATHQRYNTDLYEMTGEAAEALIRLQAADDKLEEIAGVSFFATSQFDRAEPHLKRAREMGNLDPKFMGLADTLDQCRQNWAEEVEYRKADAEANLPRVRLMTTRREIIVELFEDQAPNTVANFIALVEDEHYDLMPFYQVLPNQIALAGDPSSSPSQFSLPDEQNTEGGDRKIFRGSLVMALLPNKEGVTRRTFANTAADQFFFAYQPLPLGDPEHTVFGRIIDGMEYFSAFTPVNPTEEDKEGPPVTPDRIISAEVIRKRDHPYVPNRIDIPPYEMAARGGVPPLESQPGD